MLKGTYLAILKLMEKKNPSAHFEIVTNVEKSVLAPRSKLLVDAGIYPRRDGKRNPKMPFEQYEALFKKQIMNDEKAMKKLKELWELAKKKDVYLVCYEKDPTECHRTILLNIAKGFGVAEMIIEEVHEFNSQKKLEDFA